MDALLTAIMTKTVGSALATAVGSRIYFQEAPDGTAYPCVTFFNAGGSNENTFTEIIDDCLIQFDIYSTSPGLTEVTDVYGHLIDLFDNATLTLGSGTCLRCVRNGPPISTLEEIATTSGTVGVRHWSVDYSMMVQD